MKKLLCSVILISLFLSMLIIPAGAEWKAPGIGVVQVPYAAKGGITIDGIMDQGEWSMENSILINENYLLPFSGNNIPNPFEFYYSWGDDGLYMASVVYDTTFTKSNKAQMQRLDQFQIAFNPGGIIYKDYSGLFFSFMPSVDDNEVYATKHNWQRGDVDGVALVDDENYIGRYSETDDKWIMEVLLPWSVIATKDRTAKLDATESITLDNFNPNDTVRERAFCTATICYIDYSGSQLIAAGRTVNQSVDFLTQRGWTVDTYDIILKFLQAGETPSKETQTFEAEGPVVEPTVITADSYIVPPECFDSPQNLKYTVNADNSVSFEFIGDDPYVFVNIPGNIHINSDDYHYIALYMRTNNPYDSAQMFYATSDYNNINEGMSIRYDYEYEDEHNQIVVLDASEGQLIGGNYSQLRFDLFDNAQEEGTTFTIYALGIFKNYEDAAAFNAEGITVEDIVTTVETTAAPKEDTTAAQNTEAPATNAPDVSTKPVDKTPESKGLETWVIIVIVAAVIVVAIIVVIIIILKKKK